MFPPFQARRFVSGGLSGHPKVVCWPILKDIPESRVAERSTRVVIRSAVILTLKPTTSRTPQRGKRRWMFSSFRFLSQQPRGSNGYDHGHSDLELLTRWVSSEERLFSFVLRSYAARDKGGHNVISTSLLHEHQTAGVSTCMRGFEFSVYSQSAEPQTSILKYQISVEFA